ncbi:uncharacterized protein (UPF0262 family) [Stella humosa]|uniref:UPF0262 protein EDC65_0293 n=1 Tax=Stella humosa TaxID=94 RepID=A0A3N1MEJ5_9PROT|nr:UPF0262 family protein [Stella humosa]ROQ01117.1 uncharacterized protein (UPF0262 family) [Stella humosa]BBK31489.1 UPF0262 protein [Stella humosa]
MPMRGRSRSGSGPPAEPPRADEPAAAAPPEQRIARVTLDEHTVLRRNPDVEHERAVALFDLVEENRFALVDGPAGPYHLHLAIADSRLRILVRDAQDQPLVEILLPLLAFRRIVRDYFMICESYYAAIRRSTPSQIEAIDMGRRGLHDEGSRLLRERLADRATIDHATARRLFTLVCVLHIRG